MMAMLQKAGVLDKKGKARGGGGGRGGGGRGGDRRGGGGGRGGGWRPEGTFVQPRSEDNQNRKLKSYLDIDAPTESVINIDYGVAALPSRQAKKGREEIKGCITTRIQRSYVHMFIAIQH